MHRLSRTARFAFLIGIAGALLSAACVTPEADQTTPTGATSTPQGFYPKPTREPTATPLPAAPCSLPEPGCALAHDVAAALKAGEIPP